MRRGSAGQRMTVGRDEKKRVEDMDGKSLVVGAAAVREKGELSLES